MWLIEISIAGRTITRSVPGRRRELLGLGRVSLLSLLTRPRQSA